MPYDSATLYDSTAVYDVADVPAWPVSAHRQFYNRQSFGRQFAPSLMRGVGSTPPIVVHHSGGSWEEHPRGIIFEEHPRSIVWEEKRSS